jgi:glucose/arabinose dehydrogenase
MNRSRRPLGVIAVAMLLAAACSGGSGTVSDQSPSASLPSVSPAPTPSAPSTAEVMRVATLNQPLGMVVRAGDDALYIVSKRGKVWILRGDQIDPTPALDLSGRVTRGNEQGLLALVFSPDGRFAYVNYTDRKGDTNIVEYSWRNGRADMSTKRLVLFVNQPFPNHNGGDLVFGPDGYLYIGLGDGGSNSRSPSPGDPHKNGQNLRVLLGKMLRIQPRRPDGSLPRSGAGYAIPADNPFVGRRGAQPEIWSYGLRNPWRYSFDRQTGDLWIGDVGAGAREEVDVQPASSSGGENFGWSVMEGTVAHQQPPPNAVPPVYEYDHRAGGCAVTGGYVYRGSALPRLTGWYVFGDYCLGTINALRLESGGRVVHVLSGTDVRGLSSFGQDAGGELYAMSLEGGVYKLVP